MLRKSCSCYVPDVCGCGCGYAPACVMHMSQSVCAGAMSLLVFWSTPRQCPFCTMPHKNHSKHLGAPNCACACQPSAFSRKCVLPLGSYLHMVITHESFASFYAYTHNMCVHVYLPVRRSWRCWPWSRPCHCTLTTCVTRRLSCCDAWCPPS